MRLRTFHIEAFTREIFRGNPAIVYPLESWLPDALMQQIAAEHNLSETTFLVRANDAFEVRWFTPLVEVDLCGHGTLAAAWVLKNELGVDHDPLRFMSRSGELEVWTSGEQLTLDFPRRDPKPVEPPKALLPALGLDAAEVLAAEDFLVVLESESQVVALSPDFSRLKGLPGRGVIVTAPGESCDFVSRWFGPNVGVDEDPVTGSAHTMLAPYWCARLGKNEMRARQLSRRGGELVCAVKGERVHISGNAVKYMDGFIELSSFRSCV